MNQQIHHYDPRKNRIPEFQKQPNQIRRRWSKKLYHDAADFHSAVARSLQKSRKCAWESRIHARENEWERSIEGPNEISSVSRLNWGPEKGPKRGLGLFLVLPELRAQKRSLPSPTSIEGPKAVSCLFLVLRELRAQNRVQTRRVKRPQTLTLILWGQSSIARGGVLRCSHYAVVSSTVTERRVLLPSAVFWTILIGYVVGLIIIIFFFFTFAFFFFLFFFLNC